jgi:hypothetical protein
MTGIFIRGSRERFEVKRQREEGHMKTEAITGVTQPQAKECQRPPRIPRSHEKLKKEKGEDSPSTPPEEVYPLSP